ncbi:MAG: hypothetical protein IJZ84_01965 [Lachnospiraceae bacterium]|nr:hypothetical protein [Lachnospiraceae bacterium]
MKKIKSYLYVPVLACLLAGGGALVWNVKSDVSHKNQDQIYYLDEYFGGAVDHTSEAHVVDEKNVVVESTPKIQNQTEPEAEFILRMVDDYVMVYRTSDMSEGYMATGICAGDLPQETLQEILAGKEILDEEALYFFLETHSS